MTFLAVTLAMKPPTAERSFGYYRLEVLASLFDGGILVVLDLYIFFQVYLRLLSPPDVRGGPVIVVAMVGLALNLIGIKLLSGPSKQSLVFRGALLEVMVHALSSAGVIVAGTLIFLTGWYVADPVASVHDRYHHDTEHIQADYGKREHTHGKCSKRYLSWKS